MKEFLIEHSISIVAALFAMISMIFTILNFCSRNKRSSKLYYHNHMAMIIENNQSNNSKGLNINYNGLPIGCRIMQISGELICKGKDINTLKNQITITAPKKCKWLDISVAQNKINAFANISTNDEQVATIFFDKLRRDKSITINAYLKVGIIKSFLIEDIIPKEITFEHVIDDTDDVIIITEINYSAKASSVFEFVFPIILLIAPILANALSISISEMVIIFSALLALKHYITRNKYNI